MFHRSRAQSLMLGGAVAAIVAAMPAMAQDISQLNARLNAAVPGQYIVVPEDNQTESTFPNAAFERFGASVKSVAPGIGFRLVEIGTEESFGTEARLKALPQVKNVVPNFWSYTTQMPADPQADRLWMIDAINARKAWQVHHDAEEIVVAVIDSGVYTEHEDLKGNLWVNADEIPGNGVDDDGNGFIDDVNGWDFGDNDADPNPAVACSGVNANGGIEGGGHGTHVAGTIGAVGGNNVGVIGIAPKVKMMALKVAVNGSNSCSALSTFGILASVNYAIQNGAKIINMSLGGPNRLALSQAVMERAAAANVLVVVAAGNDGLDNDPHTPNAAVIRRNGQLARVGIAPSYPAAWNTSSMLAVSATRAADGRPGDFVDAWAAGMAYNATVTGLKYNADGSLDTSGAAFAEIPQGQTMSIGSNYGANRVHIAAPGHTVWSTAPAVANNALNSGYGNSSGTSMATPVVAGAAAVVWSAFPDMTAIQVKARLMATVQSVPSLQGKVLSGGQLDLFAALCAPGAPSVLQGCATAAETPPGATPPPPPPADDGDQPSANAPATGDGDGDTAATGFFSAPKGESPADGLGSGVQPLDLGSGQGETATPPSDGGALGNSGTQNLSGEDGIKW